MQTAVGFHDVLRIWEDSGPDSSQEEVLLTMTSSWQERVHINKTGAQIEKRVFIFACFISENA